MCDLENVKVTIAIALCNNEKDIAKCLNSVIRQSHNNLEIIIIDDGSVDESVDVVRTFEDPRIIIISKQNGGLSSTRQEALNRASGKYICFIDADDYLNGDYVYEMLKQIDSDCSNVCVCGTVFENEKGMVNETLSKSFSLINNSLEPVITGKNINKTYCKLSERFFMGDSWNKMYDLSFLKKNNISFSLPKGFNGTDTLFNYKVLLCCPNISYIKYSGYVHVSHGESAVHRKNKNLQKCFFEIESQLLNFNKLHGMKKQFSVIHYRFMLTAFQDYYDEISHEKKCSKNDISPLISNHKLFVKKYNLRRGSVLTNDFTLSLFSFFINFSSSLLLIFLKKRSARVVKY